MVEAVDRHRLRQAVDGSPRPRRWRRGDVGAGSRTANSSPPRRATRAAAGGHDVGAAEAVGDGFEDAVTGGVAEGVVDQLEAVEVDHEHRGARSSTSRASAALAMKWRRLGRPGEPVVQRLVLLLGGLLSYLVEELGGLEPGGGVPASSSRMRRSRASKDRACRSRRSATNSAPRAPSLETERHDDGVAEAELGHGVGPWRDEHRAARRQGAATRPAPPARTPSSRRSRRKPGGGAVAVRDHELGTAGGPEQALALSSRTLAGGGGGADVDLDGRR